MKEKLIKITEASKKGDLFNLRGLLFYYCKDLAFMKTLSQDKTLIKKILKDSLLPLEEAIYIGKKEQSQSIEWFLQKEKLKNIEYALQILVAFGAFKPEPDEIVNINDTPVEIYCSIRNFMDHNLDETYCISLFLRSVIYSGHYLDYLSYAQKMPELARLLDSSTINPIIEPQKQQLLDIENHSRDRSFVKFIEQRLNNLYKSQGWDMTSNNLSGLAECSCNGHERDVRQVLEAKIIEETLRRFPNKREELHYLSLGAGQLLQDFIILFKLLKEGYKDISISLVEPQLQKININAFFNNLQPLAWELNAHATFKSYFSIHHYKHLNNSKLHVISAIDFENIFKDVVFDDVIETHKLLEEDGFFLFSYDEHQLLLDKHQIYPINIPNKAQYLLDKLGESANSIGNNLLNKDTLSIACLSSELNIEFWVHLLPIIHAGSKNRMVLSMVAPRTLSYFGCQLDQKNAGFNQDNIEYFLNLSVKGKKNVSVLLFDSEDELLNSESEDYDCVFKLGFSSNKLDELYEHVEKVKRFIPSAPYYCLAQYYDDGFYVPFIEGLVKELPKKIQIIATLNHVKLQHSIPMIMNKIKKDAKSLSQKSWLSFFDRKNEKAIRILDALNRATPLVNKYLIDSEASFETAIHLLFNSGRDGKESLNEAYLFNPCIIGNAAEIQNLIEFIQETYHVDVSNILGEDLRTSQNQFS